MSCEVRFQTSICAARRLEKSYVNIKEKLYSELWHELSPVSIGVSKALSSIKLASHIDSLVLEDALTLNSYWHEEFQSRWSEFKLVLCGSLEPEVSTLLAPHAEQTVTCGASERSFKATFQFILDNELNDVLLAAQADATDKKSTWIQALEYSNQLLLLAFDNIDKIVNADTNTLRLNAIKKAKKLSKWMYSSAEKFLSPSALTGLTITIGNKGQIVIGRNESSRRPSRRSCPYSDLQFAA